jgi:hypothetical protein
MSQWQHFENCLEWGIYFTQIATTGCGFAFPRDYYEIGSFAS